MFTVGVFIVGVVTVGVVTVELYALLSDPLRSSEAHPTNEQRVRDSAIRQIKSFFIWMLYITSILYITTIVKILSIFYNENVKIFIRGYVMISYEPFYNTIKEKGISTYKLINQYGLSRSLLDRLKHNKPLTTVTIDDLCKILDCKVEDILTYKPD